MVSPLIVSLKKRKNSCGSKACILSPAKINLYLNILGKYPGGYHCIESIVERISLNDRIKITVKSDPEIKIFSNDKSLQTKDNLIVKAAELIKKHYKIPFGLSIKLEKNIPVGSGLGGGSSNAASTLIVLNTLFDLKLDKSELYKLGARLGSDVNFFISESKFALLKGRGEKLMPLKIDKKFSHFIIWPKKSISTKEVYDRQKAKLTKFFNSVKILQYALAEGDIFLIKKNIFNVLEKEACNICRELKLAKQYLSNKGIFTKVTGSGSALYTIGASSSLRIFKKGLPSSWTVFKAQTF
ncbi:MAG: 4-(cytidine 5'-diphospho)-2-C-methyl-D-erythritol kinase [Candidatus Omnitrophica bacterium]|nr:4-(cytidine 5'-diphospho)-2-C-methyl-D-erythritol kinase [Candidatus Omnitrophota bacterium]